MDDGKCLVIRSNYTSFWRNENTVLATFDLGDAELAAVALYDYCDTEYPYAYMTYEIPENNV